MCAIKTSNIVAVTTTTALVLRASSSPHLSHLYLHSPAHHLHPRRCANRFPLHWQRTVQGSFALSNLPETFLLVWWEALQGPFKNCVPLTGVRGDWSSFQLAIIRHRLDLMCTDIAPSAKIPVEAFFGSECAARDAPRGACGLLRLGCVCLVSSRLRPSYSMRISSSLHPVLVSFLGSTRFT